MKRQRHQEVRVGILGEPSGNRCHPKIVTECHSKSSLIFSDMREVILDRNWTHSKANSFVFLSELLRFAHLNIVQPEISYF